MSKGLIPLALLVWSGLALPAVAGSPEASLDRILQQINGQKALKGPVTPAVPVEPVQAAGSRQAAPVVTVQSPPQMTQKAAVVSVPASASPARKTPVALPAIPQVKAPPVADIPPAAGLPAQGAQPASMPEPRSGPARAEVLGEVYDPSLNEAPQGPDNDHPSPSLRLAQDRPSTTVSGNGPLDLGRFQVSVLNEGTPLVDGDSPAGGQPMAGSARPPRGDQIPAGWKDGLKGQRPPEAFPAPVASARSRPQPAGADIPDINVLARDPRNVFPTEVMKELQAIYLSRRPK